MSYLVNELESENAPLTAEKLCNLFLNKQVAIDLYFNFSNSIELINTFIGINTVRVDLSPVDLFRSFLVEKAFVSKWDANIIENMENDITEIFVDKEQPKTELLPFVSILLKVTENLGRLNMLFQHGKNRWILLKSIDLSNSSESSLISIIIL